MVRFIVDLPENEFMMEEFWNSTDIRMKPSGYNAVDIDRKDVQKFYDYCDSLGVRCHMAE